MPARRSTASTWRISRELSTAALQCVSNSVRPRAPAAIARSCSRLSSITGRYGTSTHHRAATAGCSAPAAARTVWRVAAISRRRAAASAGCPASRSRAAAISVARTSAASASAIGTGSVCARTTSPCRSGMIRHRWAKQSSMRCSSDGSAVIVFGTRSHSITLTYRPSVVTISPSGSTSETGSTEPSDPGRVRLTRAPPRRPGRSTIRPRRTR